MRDQRVVSFEFIVFVQLQILFLFFLWVLSSNLLSLERRESWNGRFLFRLINRVGEVLNIFLASQGFLSLFVLVKEPPTNTPSSQLFRRSDRISFEASWALKMSLAQRRTTLDGIEAISLPLRAAEEEEEGQAGDSGSTVVNNNNTTHYQQQNADEEEISSNSREETSETTPIVADTVPAEDDKEIWHTISYDPFGTVQEVEALPELQHYESFPPELGDHVAAYEVSTTKRVGE